MTSCCVITVTRPCILILMQNSEFVVQALPKIIPLSEDYHRWFNRISCRLSSTRIKTWLSKQEDLKRQTNLFANSLANIANIPRI